MVSKEYAVARCPFVRLSLSDIASKWLNISSKFSHYPAANHFTYLVRSRLCYSDASVAVCRLSVCLFVRNVLWLNGAS